MNRGTAFGIVAWIMAGEKRGRESVSDDGSSDDEEEPFDGRTYFDFESNESLPNLTVKTFLKDCIKHPKILYHRDLHFFRSYLMDIGLDLTLPPDSPFHEGHEDASFCVDKNDKWLSELKERVNSETQNEDYYWASISPVQRRSDLGLVIFKWQPLPMSIHFLHVYLKFCESKSDQNSSSSSGEYVDAYIRDFKTVFDIQRNMDVETRLKEDEEAKRIRKLTNKEEPKMTRELMLLLKTPPKRNFITVDASTSSSKPKISNERRDSSTSSSSSSDLDHRDSSTDTESSDGSHISMYKGKYLVERQSKKVKKKSNIDPKQTTKQGLSNRSDNLAKPKPSTGERINGVTSTRKLRNCDTMSAKSKESNKVDYQCKICQKNFKTRKILYRHLTRIHATSNTILIRCRCGLRVRSERIDVHKRICKKQRLS